MNGKEYKIKIKDKDRIKINRGFLVLELILSLSIFIIMISSLYLGIDSIKERKTLYEDKMFLNEEWQKIFEIEKQKSFDDFDRVQKEDFLFDGILVSRNVSYIDNYLIKVRYELKKNNISIIRELYFNDERGLGQNVCLIERKQELILIDEYELEADQEVTGIDSSGEYFFISTDSAVLSRSDLYIFSISSHMIEKIGELNTGPGANAIDIVKNVLYLGNTSSNSQLQVIDIDDLEKPSLIKNLKVSGLGDTMKAVSLLYDNSFLYLGTTKSSTSSEFFVFNVTNLENPELLGNFNIDTQINSILSFGKYVYLASPTVKELRILDVLEPTLIKEIKTFNWSGWQSQEGNYLNRSGDKIYYGRTVGGFNNKDNPEFIELINRESPDFLTEISQKDIGASVYGITENNNPIIVTGAPKGRIISNYRENGEIEIGNFGRGIKCVGDKVIVIGDSRPQIQLYEYR